MAQKIYIGADHAGWKMKEEIKTWLKDSGYEVEDLGNKILDENDDYPDFALAVAEKVADESGNFGILICASGQGMCIAANKVRGARAIVGFDENTAVASRADDDANVLCLPAREMSATNAKEIIKVWLKTEFSNEERHVRRLQKIKKMEVWT
jgi:ribose 5-phosphate isomerase B